MEKMVFHSPKRHRIIAVKKLLAGNDIPIVSIKLRLYVEWGHGGIKAGQAGIRITESREKRNELNVPIEEFNEKLNDSQRFELYTSAEHEAAAIELIEGINEEIFFGDCIFKSENYDEAFEIFSLLNRNNIPCDEIFPGADAYLLFIDPEHIEKATELINERHGEKVFKNKKRKQKEYFTPEYQERPRNDILKFILPGIIILAILSLRINGESAIEIILRHLSAPFF